MVVLLMLLAVNEAAYALWMLAYPYPPKPEEIWCHEFNVLLTLLVGLTICLLLLVANLLVVIYGNRVKKGGLPGTQDMGNSGDTIRNY